MASDSLTPSNGDGTGDFEPVGSCRLLVLLAGVGGIGIGYLSHSGSKTASGSSDKTGSQTAPTTTIAPPVLDNVDSSPNVYLPLHPLASEEHSISMRHPRRSNQLGYNVVSSPNSQETAPRGSQCRSLANARASGRDTANVHFSSSAASTSAPIPQPARLPSGCRVADQRHRRVELPPLCPG